MSAKDQSSTRMLRAVLLCGVATLIAIGLVSYSSPAIRVEHFTSMFSIVGSIATAGTLIWLVVDRSQLQYEKRENARRKQASGASAWLTRRTFGVRAHYSLPIIIINNNSDAPIYRLVVSIVDARDKDARGEATSTTFQLVIDAAPPGQVYCMAPEGSSGAGLHPYVEIAFTDTNGVPWVRRGNGKLEELKEEPFVLYKIDLPPTYEPIHKL